MAPPGPPQKSQLWDATGLTIRLEAWQYRKEKPRQQRPQRAIWKAAKRALEGREMGNVTQWFISHAWGKDGRELVETSGPS